MRKSSRFFVSIFILFNSIAYSQNVDDNELETTPINLSGSHSVYLLSGLKMNSSSSATATTSGVKTETNFMGDE